MEMVLWMHHFPQLLGNSVCTSNFSKMSATILIISLSVVSFTGNVSTPKFVSNMTKSIFLKIFLFSWFSKLLNVSFINRTQKESGKFVSNMTKSISLKIFLFSWFSKLLNVSFINRTQKESGKFVSNMTKSISLKIFLFSWFSKLLNVSFINRTQKESGQ